MTQAKRKRMLSLADRLEHENNRTSMNPNLLHIVLTFPARDVIVEALRAYAASPADGGKP